MLEEEGTRLLHERNGNYRQLPEMPDIHVERLC